ncbi:MAG: hypothetical protein ACJA09_000425 [Alcanivorax sp.]|jgi:hypothetical protein
MWRLFFATGLRHANLVLTLLKQFQLSAQQEYFLLLLCQRLVQRLQGVFLKGQLALHFFQLPR